MDMSEIAKLIEASNKAFADFQAANEIRLKRLEVDAPGKTQEEFKGEMKKAFDEMGKLKDVILTIEAKLKRPGTGGGLSEQEELVAEHRKAFDGYLRKGVKYDLALEQKALAISTNAGADGGYAMPKVIDSEIEALVINLSPIRTIAKVQAIGTQDFHKLVNLRGTASGWVGETAARTATATPTLADLKPTMGDLYAFPQATQQMLDDVFFNAASWLADEVATEVARNEGNAFVVGDGTNKPTGMLTATIVATGDASRAFGSVQYVPTGVAGLFAASNPVDIFYTTLAQLKAPYRANTKILTNKAILFEVAAFKDSSGRYVFTPISAPGVPPAILGYPIIEAEDVPAKAANSYSILVGDFMRYYLIVDRFGTRVIRDDISNKPYVGFYSWRRVGGMIVNSEAVKLVKFAAS